MNTTQLINNGIDFISQNFTFLDRNADMFKMFVMQNKSYREIAQHYQISVQRTRSLIRKFYYVNIVPRKEDLPRELYLVITNKLFQVKPPNGYELTAIETITD